MVETDSVSAPSASRATARPALFVIIAGAILVGSAYFFPQSTASGSPLIALLFSVSTQCKSLDATALTNCQYQSYWESAWLLLPLFLSCGIVACAVMQINSPRQKWLVPTLLALISTNILIFGYLIGYNVQSIIMLLVIGSDVPNFLIAIGDAALLVGGAMLLAKTLRSAPDPHPTEPETVTYTPQLSSAVFGVLGSGLALIGFFLVPWIRFPSGSFANGWIILVHAAASSVSTAILDAIFLPGMLFIALILSVLALFVKPHPLLTGGYCAAVAISVLGALQFFSLSFVETLFGGCFADCPNPKTVITPFVILFVAALLVMLASAFLMMQQTPKVRSTSPWVAGSFLVAIGSFLVLISSFLAMSASSSVWGFALRLLTTRGIPAFLSVTLGFWVALAACVSGIIAVLRGPGRWTTSLQLIGAADLILSPSLTFNQSFLSVLRGNGQVPIGDNSSAIVVQVGAAIWLAGAIAALLQLSAPQQHDLSPVASARRTSSFIALGGVLLGALLTLPWFFVPTAPQGESYWQLLQQATHSSFSATLNASLFLIVSMPLIITAVVIILAVTGFFVRQPLVGIVLVSLTLLLLLFLYWNYDVSSLSPSFFAIGNTTGIFFRMGVLLEVIAATVWLQLLLNDQQATVNPLPDSAAPSASL